MFSTVYFEISGKCNGRCHWCQTGRQNKNHEPTGGFVDVDEFEKTLSYLLEKKAIRNESQIRLFNWGEPSLHPQLTEIIRILNNMKLNWGISTNASKKVLFSDNDAFINCQYLCFSMCGFSQASYDKIHGFNFEKIRNNIAELTENYRSCGLSATPYIAYHIYQHNIEELRSAIMFAAQHKLGILPSYALINDHERWLKYIKGELEYEDVLRASRELFLQPFHSDEFKNRPPFTTCGQFAFLSLDSNCNLITCCGDSTIIGKVHEIDLKKINSIRRNSEACQKCIDSGAYFFDHAVPSPSTIINGAMHGLLPFLKNQKNAGIFTPRFPQ